MNSIDLHSSNHLINEIIKKSWDENVLIRATDLEEYTDVSYNKLILPWVMSKVMHNTSEKSQIIDIGCGCGYLTNIIYEKGRKNILGIDISPVSVKYAQSKYPKIPFVCEDICNMRDLDKCDLCLAVMVLNNMPDIQVFFSSVQKLLGTQGKLILVIPHPCFWPQHHLKTDRFVYTDEKFYEFSFATQGRNDYSSKVLYFHRMLETYLYYIKQSGFEILEFHEITEINTNRNPDILCMELKHSIK